MGLRGSCLRSEGGDRTSHRPVCGHGDRAAVVGDLERRPLEQGVAGLLVGDLDPQPPLAKAHAEGEPGESLGQAGREAELAVVVAHPAESGDGGDPGAGQRGDVQAVAGVVLEVLEVHQGGLGEVVVGQLEVSDLGGDHRLGAGRERGVAHGQRLVVGEVPRLLLAR